MQFKNKNWDIKAKYMGITVCCSTAAEWLESCFSSLGTRSKIGSFPFCPSAVGSGFSSLQFMYLKICSLQVLWYNASAIRCK